MKSFLFRCTFRTIVRLLIMVSVIYCLASLLVSFDRMVPWMGHGKIDTAGMSMVALGGTQDKPWYVWYPAWLVGDTWMQGKWQGERQGIVRGDMGYSWKFQQGTSIRNIIDNKLSDSMRIIVASICISLLIGIPLGLIATMCGSAMWWKRGLTTMHVVTRSLPLFWVGLLLIIASLWAKEHGWFYLPTTDRFALRDYYIPLLGVVTRGSILDQYEHVLLPALTLSFINLAAWLELIKTDMLKPLKPADLRIAQSKGISRFRIVIRHTRYIFMPLLSVIVASMPATISALCFVEMIFNYQGLFHSYVVILDLYDLPLVMGSLVVFAILTCLTTFVSAMLNAKMKLRTHLV